MANNLTSFSYSPSATPQDVQKDAYLAFQQLGPLAYAKEFIGVTVGTTSTAIPHGLRYAPRHVLVSLGETGAVTQAQAPDATYVYLITTGAAKTVNLLVV